MILKKSPVGIGSQIILFGSTSLRNANLDKNIV
jgi:hypothetical protein